jgi:hypothetical protein
MLIFFGHYFSIIRPRMGSFVGDFYLEDKDLRVLNLYVSVSASNLSYQSQKLYCHMFAPTS